jgi:hypothetical protein
LGKEKNETFGSLRFEIQLIALQREGIWLLRMQHLN